MAKRKKSKTGRRRRRVGAMSLAPSSPLVIYGSIAAGYFLGAKINDQLAKVTGTLDKKIVGGAEAGLGFLLAFKGRKTLPKTLIGGLLIGAGAKQLMTAMGVVSGFRSVPVLNGFRSVPVIGQNHTNTSSLRGYNVPGTVQGYNVPTKVKTMGSAYPNGSGINADSR